MKTESENCPSFANRPLGKLCELEKAAMLDEFNMPDDFIPSGKRRIRHGNGMTLWNRIKMWIGY